MLKLGYILSEPIFFITFADDFVNLFLKSVIELSRHIEILLLDNDCVIVPGLGGFVAHYVEAEYVDNQELFYPPIRTIGFNSQLQINDSLLAQSYVEAYDLSYPEAVRRIESEVDDVKHSLSIDGEYDFHGIGTLVLTSSGQYDFHPCAAGLLTPSLYALNSFAIRALLDEPSTIKVTTKPVVIDDDSEHQQEVAGASYDVDGNVLRLKYSALRSVALAAVLLLLFIMSTIPAGTGSSYIQQCSVVSSNLLSKIVKTDSRDVQLSASHDTVFQEQPKAAGISRDAKHSDEVSVPESRPSVSTHYYVLVVAARVSRSGARGLVSKLKKNGFTDTNISEKTSNRKVIYGHYKTEREALDALINLRNQDITFTDAWISRI